jgi:uncharacterized protein
MTKRTNPDGTPMKRGPKPGSEAAKRGGRAAFEHLGREFYARIGRKGGQEAKARHGSEHYAAIGRKGGEKTKATHGLDFYQRIGKIGGKRRRKDAMEEASS